MRELELNNEICELGDDLIAITTQAYNFESLESRNINISNSFEIPITNKNRDILNRPESLASNTDTFEKKVPAKYSDNGLLFDGYALIEEASKYNYSVQLVEKVKEFFDNIKENLNRLDVDDYDFVFNSTNFTALNTPGNNIWVWPITNQHEDRTAAKLPGTSLLYNRPLLNFGYLLELIFAKNNWTLELDGLDVVNNLCFTSNHEDFFFCSYEKIVDGTQTVGQIPDLATNDFEDANYVSVSANKLVYSDPVYLRLRGNVSVDTQVTVTFSSANLTQTFIIPANTTYIDFRTDKFEGANNIEITISGTVDFDNTRLYAIHSEVDFDLSTNPITGTRIKSYDNLIKITQSDLVKEVFKMFGAVYNNDNLNRKSTYFPINKVSKNNAVDWSDKVIIDDYTINNVYGNYGQRNVLKYTNDETIYIDTGQGEFTISSEILPDEQIVIESMFGASLDVTIGGNIMGELLMYSDTGRLDEDKDRFIRIYEMYESGGTYYAKFQNLEFNNLIQNYWKSLFDALSRTRPLTVSFDLRKNDVLAFDNKKSVYINYFNSYFFCLSRDEFIEGKPTECKLLKL